jgi:hypothetical protein
MSSKSKAPDGSIEVGDQVRVSKGARVFDIRHRSYADGSYADSSSETARAVTATVTDIIESPRNWVTFLPQSEIDKIEGLMALVWGGSQIGGVRYLLTWMSGDIPKGNAVAFPKLAQALLDAQEQYRAIYGKNPRFVVWGKREARAALVEDCTKVDAKAAKKAAPKETKITKRRLMVKNSKWRFTKDVEVSRWIDNPEIDKLCAQRNAIRQSDHSHRLVGRTMVVTLGGNHTTPVQNKQVETIQRQIDELLRDEPSVLIKAGTIPAGVEFTVTGKLSPEYGSSRRRKSTNGLMVPVEVTKGILDAPPRAFKHEWGKGMVFPYSQIEAAVEPLEVPETIVYVLRDSETREFFGGWKLDAKGYQTEEPKMSKTFSGAKKYKTSAAVKASIRDFTGYNFDINDDGEYGPEWASGAKKIDLPETWEIVAIDKTTNTEKTTIEVQDWFKGLMRLRVLTQKHGSAVRAAYKKAEESADDYEAILLFQHIGSGSDDRVPFDEANGKTILANIKIAADNMVDKKLRVKTQSAVAYACSVDDAVMAKIKFTNHPNVVTRILDAKTLARLFAAELDWHSWPGLVASDVINEIKSRRGSQ